MFRATSRLSDYSATRPASCQRPSVVAFVFIQIDADLGADPEEYLLQLPEVEEAHRVAGEDCYVVKVRVTDLAGLEKVLTEKFYTIDSLRSIRTTLVLKTVK